MLISKDTLGTHYSLARQTLLYFAAAPQHRALLKGKMRTVSQLSVPLTNSNDMCIQVCLELDSMAQKVS